MSTYNNTHHRSGYGNRLPGGKLPAPFIVTLECGCKRRTVNNPMARTKYACPSGQGHGYSLNWVSWTNQQTGWSGTSKAPEVRS